LGNRPAKGLNFSGRFPNCRAQQSELQYATLIAREIIE
jgi:hypothetical protein